MERKRRMKAKPVSFSLQNLTGHQAKKLSIFLFAVLFLLILIIALFPLLDGDTRQFDAATYSMGTYVQQTVYGKEREAAAETAANTIQLFDERASWDGENSEIFELNLQAGREWITLSENIFSVLLTAQEIAEKSGGAFDITTAPVSRLWDFDNNRQEVPDSELLGEMLPYVGYKNLRLGLADHSASLKYHGNAVDLSPVLHGAACSTAINVYKEYKVSAAIVSAGNSVGLYGKKPDGTLWNIAIPTPDGTGTLGTTALKEGFLSTASIYENSFTADGKLYHAVLDPTTGYPAESDLCSVTVFSDDGVLSDALSKACLVLGYEKSLPLLKAYNAEGIFVGKDNAVYVTTGVLTAFELTNESFTMHK